MVMELSAPGWNRKSGWEGSGGGGRRRGAAGVEGLGVQSETETKWYFKKYRGLFVNIWIAT